MIRMKHAVTIKWYQLLPKYLLTFHYYYNFLALAKHIIEHSKSNDTGERSVYTQTWAIYVLRSNYNNKE